VVLPWRWATAVLRSPRALECGATRIVLGDRPVLFLGLISISMGSLQLGIRLFVGGLKTTAFTRPLGQMVIATLLNAVLAVGLAVCVLLIGERWNAADPTSAAWDGWTLGITAALLVGQGAVLRSTRGGGGRVIEIRTSLSTMSPTSSRRRNAPAREASQLRLPHRRMKQGSPRSTSPHGSHSLAQPRFQNEPLLIPLSFR